MHAGLRRPIAPQIQRLARLPIGRVGLESRRGLRRVVHREVVDVLVGEPAASGCITGLSRMPSLNSCNCSAM